MWRRTPARASIAHDRSKSVSSWLPRRQAACEGPGAGPRVEDPAQRHDHILREPAVSGAVPKVLKIVVPPGRVVVAGSCLHIGRMPANDPRANGQAPICCRQLPDHEIADAAVKSP